MVVEMRGEREGERERERERERGTREQMRHFPLGQRSHGQEVTKESKKIAKPTS
jgi:hypothetical protein